MNGLIDVVSTTDTIHRASHSIRYHSGCIRRYYASRPLVDETRPTVGSMAFVVPLVKSNGPSVAFIVG